MSLELLGIVLNACLTGILAIYIIWDHVKDDRFLAEKVKEFYKNIKNLIFFYCLTKMIDSISTEPKEEIKDPLSRLKPISDLLRLRSSLPEILSPLPTIREYFSNEHSYYQAKVIKEFLAPTRHSDLLSKDEKFVDLPKYLDLIFLEGDNKGKMQYMNKTFFVLYENGKLQRRPGKEIIEDYSDIKNESYDIINWYLKSLRDYWNKNHHKLFVRPKLKDSGDFKEDLMNPVSFFEKEFTPKFKEDYFTIGNLLTYLRNYKSAIIFFDKALEIEPNYKEALNNKGWILVAQQRYDDAFKYLNKVIKIDPNNILALSNKGWALVAQVYYEDALKYLNKALEIDPNYIFALNNKGYALNGLERYDEALKYCDKVLKMEPKDIFVLNSKGIALGGLKRYKETLECLDKALEIEPNYIFALNIKGIALGGLERYEETLEYLDKALEIDPNDKFALIIKGITLRGLGRYEEALEYLDKALEIDSNYAIAWYNKARLESLRNNLEESIKSLKNAIELDNSLWGKAMGEHDFDNIRNTQEFRKLIYDE